MFGFPRIKNADYYKVNTFVIAAYGYAGGSPDPRLGDKMKYNPGSEIVITEDREGRPQWYALMRQGWRAKLGQGSAPGQVGQPSAAGGNTAAANAMQKQYTGGGDGVDIGIGDQKTAVTPVAGAFLGMTLIAADNKVPPGKSPDCLNVDGLAIEGALGPRFGLIQAVPRRYDSVTGAGPVIGAAYRGRSINMLSQAFWQSNVPTGVITYDKSLIGAVGASYTRTVSKQLRTGWNPQHDISKVPPTIRFVSGGSTSLSLGITMPQRFRSDLTNGVIASVDEYVLRRSTVSFPRDYDGREYQSTAATNFTSLATRLIASGAHNGASAVVAMADIVSGTTYFLTAWVKSKQATSPPAHFKYTAP